VDSNNFRCSKNFTCMEKFLLPKTHASRRFATELGDSNIREIGNQKHGVKINGGKFMLYPPDIVLNLLVLMVFSHMSTTVGWHLTMPNKSYIPLL
jgi:hypothetical protein